MRYVIVLLLLIFFCLAATGSPRAGPGAAVTYEKEEMEAQSYYLATAEQAAIWARGMHDTWISWPARDFEPLLLKTLASLRAAEEAARIDGGNGFARGLLARLYLLPRDTFEEAKLHWKEVLQGGGALNFLAYVQEIEPATPFLFSMRREGLYVYTMQQLGVELPGPLPPSSGTLFWESYAGRVPAEIPPCAVISWEDITEISSSGWGESFILGREVTLKNDGGREKKFERLRVFLAAGIGRFRWEINWYEIMRQKILIMTPPWGPADYNARLREAMLLFFDPARRIKAPPLSNPRPGW